MASETCGGSSAGRAEVFQTSGRESESRPPLKNYARVAQLAEARGLGPRQCEFESHHVYEKKTTPR